jgi:hypothetical protein
VSLEQTEAQPPAGGRVAGWPTTADKLQTRERSRRRGLRNLLKPCNRNFGAPERTRIARRVAEHANRAPGSRFFYLNESYGVHRFQGRRTAWSVSTHIHIERFANSQHDLSVWSANRRQSLHASFQSEDLKAAGIGGHTVRQADSGWVLGFFSHLSLYEFWPQTRRMAGNGFGPYLWDSM